MTDDTSGRYKTVALAQTQAESAGAQEIARQLAAGFEKRGWRTRQIFFYRRTDAFDDDPHAFYCMKSRPRSPLDVFQMARALYGEFRREQPDVVVTLQHYGNLVAAPIARAAGVPLVIANQLTGAELVPGVARLVDMAIGAVGFYDHIVVNSAEVEAAYAHYPKIYSRRVRRIDHGFCDKSVSISKIDARTRLSLPQGVELLGCAARLHPLKQLDCAIRLLLENSAQHLALAGQGDDCDRLRRLAHALGVAERVHFVGELKPCEMGVFLATLDCFVFPSAVESFGLAPVEAAQAGVPVVVNDISVLRDVLAVDGKPCALFVDVQDTRRFTAAVRRAIDDVKLAGEMRLRGQHLIERFPLDTMIEDFMQLMTTPVSAMSELTSPSVSHG